MVCEATRRRSRQQSPVNVLAVRQAHGKLASLSPDNGDTSPLQAQSGRFAQTETDLSAPPTLIRLDSTLSSVVMAFPPSIKMATNSFPLQKQSTTLNAGKQEENEELLEIFCNNVGILL
jgi:hypothetical protein